MKTSVNANKYDKNTQYNKLAFTDIYIYQCNLDFYFIFV